MTEDDLRAFQEKLRSKLAPVHRCLDVLKLSVDLSGRTSDFHVTIEAESRPERGFPTRTSVDSDIQTRFYGRGNNLEEASAMFEDDVDSAIGEWMEVVRVDARFRYSTDRSVEVLKALDYRAGAGMKRLTVPLKTTGIVVEHQPGWVFVNFGKGHGRVPIEHWRWTTGFTHYEDKDGKNTGTVWAGEGSREVFVPEPYVRFVDGYAPWEKE